MGQELFNDGYHRCVVFRDLISGDAVQANQFLIVDHGHAALIDPGGELTYSRLFMAISQYVHVNQLDYVIASHQDPDVVASVNKWLTGTQCRVVVSDVWKQLLPHLTRQGKLHDRTVAIPDAGIKLRLGQIQLFALPAHFLHAEGNFSFYDPVSKIVFSGDIGANFVPDDLDRPAIRLRQMLPHMVGFHRRNMNSNKVCRFWVNMIRSLDVDAIVPQHGRAFIGKKLVNEFLDWLERLECGIDLVTQDHYQIPKAAT